MRLNERISPRALFYQLLEVVRDTGFEYVVFKDKNSLFDPKVTKR